MDEAEKYQQRLQAIAEKRRMQEEQERAKRDMEDERLRLQQLKRKSLRDQWLMEGPPSSPTSPSSQDSGPHSPLWGPHTPETEKRIDELQEQSRRLAEGEQPKEQTEDGRTEIVLAADAPADVLQNGRENTTSSDSTEAVAANGLSSSLDETPAVLTNGSAGQEAETNHVASEIINSSVETSPEPVLVSDGTITTALLGYVQAEQGLTPPVMEVNEVEEEEEEGVLVMRAERIVILSDEDVPPQGQEEDGGQEEEEQREEEVGSAVQLDTVQGVGEVEVEVVRVEPEATPLETPVVAPCVEQPRETGEAPGETGEAPGEMGEAPGTVAVSDSTADVPTAGEEVSNQAAAEEEGVADGDGSFAPGPDPSPQAPAGAPGDHAAASVPIYSQGPPSPRLGPEGGMATGVGAPAAEEEAGAPAAAAAEEAAGGGGSELPSPIASAFQDVPLAEPQGSGARPAEQEPLLGRAKAPQTKAAGLGSAEARRGPPSGAMANAPSASPSAPTSSRGGAEGVSPKHKSCQCCSVM